MTRSRPSSRSRGTAPERRPARARNAPDPLFRHHTALAAGLLALHLAGAVWVALSNSVTFDENFHVPAGVRILRGRDFASSYAQPPLPETIYGAGAAGAGGAA